MTTVNTLRIFKGANPYGVTSMALADISLQETPPTNWLEQVPQLINILERLQPAHVNDWIVTLPPLPNFRALSTIGGIIGYVALVLQRWAGFPTSKITIPLPGDKDLGSAHSTVAIEYCLLHPLGMALSASVALVTKFLKAESAFTSYSEIQEVTKFVERYVDKPGNHVSFIREAVMRDIPWESASSDDQVFNFGYGKKAKRQWRHFTSKTSHIATILSTRKDLANSVLRRHGLPVPKQRLAHNIKDAIKAFEELGSPVVLKPISQDFGKGVSPGLTTKDQIEQAFNYASPYGPVIIEEHIPGDQHRLMVICDSFVSARRQIPAHVIGDGLTTITELAEIANQVRLRNGWKPIPLDSEAREILSRRQLFLDSVPPIGERVELRLQANLSTGGSMDVVTDEVHPDNALLALRAARALDIDVAGIDFITKDISRSYRDVGGGICEVNVSPGFIFEEHKQLLEYWFPSSEASRVPVLGMLTISPDSHLATCLPKYILEQKSSDISIATPRIFQVNSTIVKETSDEDPNLISMALFEPTSELVFLQFSPKLVLNRGSMVSRLDLLIIDYLGMEPPSSQLTSAASILAGVARNVLLLSQKSNIEALITSDSSTEITALRPDSTTVTCTNCNSVVSRDYVSVTKEIDKYIEK